MKEGEREDLGSAARVLYSEMPGTISTSALQGCQEKGANSFSDLHYCVSCLNKARCLVSLYGEEASCSYIEADYQLV